MSQAAFLRAFDAAASAAFLAAGIADAGAYLSPAALADLQAIADHDPDDPEVPPPPAVPVPVACTVLVDRNVEDFGDDAAPVSVHRTRVSFQRAELAPAQGGRVTLLDALGAPLETFELVQRARADESLSAWWVQEVADA